MNRMTNFRSAAIATGNAINDSAYDNIKLVADNIASVITTAGIAVPIQSVYTDKTAIDTVATNIVDVNTIATNIANINTVATNITNVDNVATNIAKGASSEILNAESNAIAALSYLEDFKGRYFGGLTSDPITDLNGNALTDGDLYFNTTVKAFRAYDSATSSWIELDVYTKTDVDTVNTFRADKYLASQDIAQMYYDASGNLSKIQYNTASDTDYEIFNYDVSGQLVSINHYTGGVLQGTTALTYTNGTLVSVVYA